MYVVDANVAIKWVVDQTGSDKAHDLATSGKALLAPHLFVSEVSNSLWKYVNGKFIAAEQARSGLLTMIRLISLYVADRDLAQRAWELSIKISHPPYDFFYLALAEQRSAQFVTADKKLIAKLKGTQHAANIVMLADWKG